MNPQTEYLEAMGITVWVRRGSEPGKAVDQSNHLCAEHSKAYLSETEVQSSRLQKSIDQSDSTQTALLDSKPSIAKQTENTQTLQSEINPQLPVNASLKGLELEQPDRQAERNANRSIASNHRLSGYLVTVPNHRWQTDSVWVLCRHQSGQPAQSFVRQGKPSKTVSNMIRALNILAELKNEHVAENVFQFAQLASTALSENTLALETVLQQTPPKAILLLGEATANLIYGESLTLQQWQLMSRTLMDTIPCVISYHPYEIFQTPQVKKQVQQDLLRMAGFLAYD